MSAEPHHIGPDASSGPLVVLYGIRHHGPGSARALLRALEQRPPDVVLIEGPPEADRLVDLVADPAMRPPVALLGYVIDRPEHASFSPFASFSPEWVAMRWAVDHGVPVRFIDLPLANTLAPRTASQEALASAESNGGDGFRPDDGATGDDPPEDPPDDGRRSGRPPDPIAVLADAAGYDDAERWWEDVLEHRSDAGSPFDAVAEAMTALREVYEPTGEPVDEQERRREARMRTGIRAAVSDGFGAIAVVCGAWHVPALGNADDRRRAKADASLLRGLAKVKTAVTWVPWTHRRLASSSGYRAGVTAPGWYHHLFAHSATRLDEIGADDTIIRWFTAAARVLREADHATSAADVVEATRLATSLAGLRGRPLAGLLEVDDAARAVLGDGTDIPMRLISNELVVGTQIGQVPSSTPMVPLAKDLAIEQRRCRLKPESGTRTLELDLRKPLDLRRSRLLHRLALVRVPWGLEAEGRRSVGTFRETWQLHWEPEWEVRLIEASALGTTVVAAAAAALGQRASGSATLDQLTGALEQGLLADLADAVPAVIALIEQQSALASDVVALMEAVIPLARTIRYGDIRGTDADSLRSVVASMAVRIAAGLAPACTGVDDAAASRLAGLLDETHSSLMMLGDETLVAELRRAVRTIVERVRIHGMIQGRATRLLADADVLTPLDVELRVSRAMSPGTAALDAAAFVEGFLGGSGTLLVHDPVLLGLLDRWIASLAVESFTDALPLLRRTFGAFEAAERRQIGERVRSGQAPGTQHGAFELDAERVAAALVTIGALLGIGGEQ